MRLLTKATLYYLIIIVLVMLAGGIYTYQIFEREILLETDRYLAERLALVADRLKAGAEINMIGDEKIYVRKLEPSPDGQITGTRQFSDTLVYHQFLSRNEINRKLTSCINVDGSYYQVEIYDVIVESDDILDSVIKSQTRLFVILGVIMIAGSLILSKWLFIPFERTLDKIKQFNLKDLQPIRLEKTGTREFSILNRFITQMTEKIRQDYLALKEFSENASHELQTPVAIIKGKLELLSQSENLTREQMDYLASAQDAAGHMGQLHQSLTMLMKIENREFSNLKELNFSEELDHLIRDFRELIELRNLRMDYSIDPDITVKNDQLLIRILLSNLLQNAIRHNQENGEIGIYLHKSELIIKNTGENPGIPTNELFKRFKKAKQSARSSGLGLAIVSEICEISGYKLDYCYLDGWHQVTVNLKES